MSLSSEVESKSFRTFTLFIFVGLLIFSLVVSIFSSKYRVSVINYDNGLDLNYEGLQEVENLSIWLVNDGNFDKFYFDNQNVENLEISKQLPNVINVNINLYQKMVVYTDFRDSSPEQRVLYKNLYSTVVVSEENLAHLVITNGPIDDGFYNEIVSFILTVGKYEIDLGKISMTFNGDTLVVNYSDTIIEAGKALDLSRKGSVVGYILEKGDCKGSVKILESSNEDIETLFNC